MKNVILFLTCLSVCFSGLAQDITGKWLGDLDVYGTNLPLVFHIDSSENGYQAKLDSPKQSAFDIPVDHISFEDDQLLIKISSLNASYSGELSEDQTEFSGEFEQNQMEFPLKLIRQDATTNQNQEEYTSPKRYQEPKKPYPYITEEIDFQNEQQNLRLAGTLSLPEEEEKYPSVILITGSGPQNRDEEILNHKPFLVIADYLTRNGIAVLRYDDRGVAESEGNFEGATTADFATDAKAAFDYLKTRKEIDSTKIGLIGHSEGALIAIKLAAQYHDIGFIGLLAGPGVDGGEVLLRQQELISGASGITDSYIQQSKKINKKAYAIIRRENDSAALRDKLKIHFDQASQEFPDWISGKPQAMTDDKFLNMLIDTYTDPWMRYFIGYDPAKDLEKVSCPVLALNGDKDLQVDAEQNLRVIETILEKSNNDLNLTQELKGLNHLFQESETGLPSEYGKLDETFSPKALKIIKDWILRVSKEI